MTKKEIIEKVRAAADRILKSSEDAVAVLAALAAMHKEVSAAEAAVKGGVIDYEALYEECSDIYMILSSIRNGYPMVPAGGEVVEAAKRLPGAVAKAMKPAELIEHVIAELEAVSKLKKRDEIAPRVLAVKAALFAWEQEPEGTMSVPVTVIDLTTKNGDVAVTSTTVNPGSVSGAVAAGANGISENNTGGTVAGAGAAASNPMPTITTDAGTYGFAKGAAERADALAVKKRNEPVKWARDLAAEKA